MLRVGRLLASGGRFVSSNAPTPAQGREAARSVSSVSDLVAPFALRQTTVFSLPCLGIYHWLRTKLLIRRRVLHCLTRATQALAAAAQFALRAQPTRRLRRGCILRSATAHRDATHPPLQKVGEEQTRGVECRAERHAAERFGGCAAEHAARRGGRIRPTKHRSAKRREGAGSYDEWSGREAETGCGATNTQGAMRGKFRRRSRAHRSRSRRIAQDCDPTAYMHTPSGSMDAQAGRAAQGARLRRNLPHADRQGQRYRGKMKTNQAFNDAGDRRGRWACRRTARQAAPRRRLSVSSQTLRLA